MNQSPGAKYVLLYIPFFLALLTSGSPVMSYFIAWGGSFWVFFLSMSGMIKPLPKDRSFAEQFLRPVILIQIIFASYMSVTSIFYFLDSIGYYYLTFDPFRVKADYEIELLSQCQRYYLLAHTAYVHGILFMMNYDEKPKWKVKYKSISVFMLQLTAAFSVLATFVRFAPGLGQFEVKFAGLSFTASVIAFAYALPEKKRVPTLIATGLFAYNMLHALVSGWKEEIIVPLIMLAVFIFPFYKRVVITVFPILFAAFFTIVPTYNNIVRSLSWSGDVPADQAAEIAIDRMLAGDVDIAASNWLFLTGRLSEIGMFVEYVNGIPALRDFYGFEIAGQAVMAIIPRALYPSKPITEDLVEQRVIAAGVIAEYSADNVSAKPPMITDAYLSAGGFGVFLFMLLLGMLVSWLSVTAEKLFGGYLMGSGLVCTGLFQMLWRGNCFEFLSNAVFWSVVVMFLLFYAGRKIGIIQPVEQEEEESNPNVAQFA